MSNTVETAIIYKLKELVAYENGSTVSKKLTKNENGNTTLFSFDKNQGLSEHTAPFDATVIILDGACQIWIDGKEHNLKEGEVIIMPANIPHALLATEAFKMLLIMIKNEKK